MIPIWHARLVVEPGGIVTTLAIVHADDGGMHILLDPQPGETSREVIVDMTVEPQPGTTERKRRAPTYGPCPRCRRGELVEIEGYQQSGDHLYPVTFIGCYECGYIEGEHEPDDELDDDPVVEPAPPEQ